MPDPSADRLAELERRCAYLEQRLASLEAIAFASPPPHGSTPQPPPSWQAAAPGPWGGGPAGPPLAPPKPARASFQVSPPHLIAAAGALIFLMGAAYFLHWSIERGYLTPTIRVALGVATGLGMSLGALRLLRGGSVALGTCVYLAGMGTTAFSLYYGAMIHPLFAPEVGFGGVATTVVLSAILSVRVPSPWILAFGYALGLASPLIFDTGSENYVGLGIYVVVLQCLVFGVLTSSQQGAQWRAARAIGLAGSWLLLLVVSGEAGDRRTWAVLVLLVLALGTSWAWLALPRHRERPCWTGLLWAWTSAMASLCGWLVWAECDWAGRPFGWVLLGQALLDLVALLALRRRLGDRSSDAGPVVAGLAHLLTAPPVLLELEAATLVWAVMAVAAATATLAGSRSLPGSRGWFAVAAFVVVAVSTGGWLVVLGEPPGAAGAPLAVSTVLVDGILCSTAFAFLAYAGPGANPRPLAFVCAQVVFHVTLSFEAHQALVAGHEQWARIAATLVWAVSGAAHVLASPSFRDAGWQRLVARAGYAWLGLAAAKLLSFDLAESSTAVRALAALAVGVIFLATALLAGRRRPTSVSSRPEP